MLDGSPSPEDLESYRYTEMLRQPGNVARLLAYRDRREQPYREALDPWVVFNPRGAGSLDSSMDYQLPLHRSDARNLLDTLPFLAGAATPGLPAALGRGLSGLGALRRAYNARNEQVYGPQTNYGYYGPGQRTFDAATAHGDSDMVGPIARQLGYELEPEMHHAPNIYDLLGVRP